MPAIRPLPPALAKAAKEELNEEPARLEADLQHLKDWIAKQPHLRARTDDQFLVAFLRGCKFSLERAKEKLDAFYTLRSALPDYFRKRDPTLPVVREIIASGVFLPLGVDAQGRRVILMRMGAFDPNKMRIQDMFKTNMMLTDMMIMEDDELIIKGQVNVIDLKGITVAHVTQMSPSLAKQSATVFQDGYPLRPKAFHYIHLNSTFEAIFKLFRSFMKKKFQERINVHADPEALFKFVPKEHLPQEYGGNAGTIKEITDKLIAKIETYKDFFLEDDKYWADESKRPGKPKTYEDLFGMEGSFRPLTVD